MNSYRDCERPPPDKLPSLGPARIQHLWVVVIGTEQFAQRWAGPVDDLLAAVRQFAHNQFNVFGHISSFRRLLFAFATIPSVAASCISLTGRRTDKGGRACRYRSRGNGAIVLDAGAFEPDGACPGARAWESSEKRKRQPGEERQMARFLVYQSLGQWNAATWTDMSAP